MIESASMKKLGVEPGAVEAAGAAAPPSQDPPAAKNVLKKSFSSSMPVLRNSIQDLSGGKAMGHLIKGFDELSDEQSVNALRYIQVAGCPSRGAHVFRRAHARGVASCTLSSARTRCGVYTVVPARRLGCGTLVRQAVVPCAHH